VATKKDNTVRSALISRALLLGPFLAVGHWAQTDRVELKDLLVEALNNNPEITAAQKRYEATRQRPSQVSSLPDPMISPGYNSSGRPWPAGRSSAENEQFRAVLSNDLGAILGLLFERGLRASAIVATSRCRTTWPKAKPTRRCSICYAGLAVLSATKSVWQATTAASPSTATTSRNCAGPVCLLSASMKPSGTIKLIEVLWLEKGTHRIVSAFEVEKSTSIYSGILILSDLALALPDHDTKLCLVLPTFARRR
jgi:hypothetical protein